MEVSRRRFLAASAAAAIAPAFPEYARADSGTPVNLVPHEPSGAPNYWCTWALQNYMYGQNLERVDPARLEGDAGAELARIAMTEDNLFSAQGWAKSFYPKVRHDLYLLLDDGWEKGGTASFELDTEKFPSFNGDPSARLGKLASAIQNCGWRGAALWCRNTPEGERMGRLEALSDQAGVRYWKIDIGDPEFGLVHVRNEKHIPLTLEHVHGEAAVNGDWHTDGRFGAQLWNSRRMTILRNTDVYRTYDVTSILSIPTTLDRLASMLEGAQGHPEVKGLLNVEDEAYIAAVMGCTMGIMRHPLDGKRPGPDYDLFFNGPRETKRRSDEVIRALRWQRVAPPFSPGEGTITIDREILTDTWTFARTQTWQPDLVGATVHQGAPARITRNLPLPLVSTKGDKPFVYAARFPNGAVAIAAQERTRVGEAWYMPACDLTLAVSDAPGPFAIFGSPRSVTFVFDKRVSGKRVMAQDLAGDTAVDIAHRVHLRGNYLHIPGEVIRTEGLRHATPGDISSPGLVIALV